MVLPLAVDVEHPRRPWANWALMAATVAVFLAPSGAEGDYPEPLSSLALDGLGIGMVTHVLVHGDVLHLLGNMLVLWVFGNAVCARVGSLRYLVLYFAFAIAAGVTHLMFSDRPAIGASGAINGIVGMFLVFYPKDYVTVGLFSVGRVQQVPAWMLVLGWVIVDSLGVLAGETGVAHAAHLGGLVAGIVVAVVLVKQRWVDEGVSATLLDLNWRR